MSAQGVATFVDQGRALLVARYGGIALVDPSKRTLARNIVLNSQWVPDRGGTPVQGASRSRELREERWAWRDRDRSLVGVVCVTGTGDLRYGLGVWAPATQAEPTMVEGFHGGDCVPRLMWLRPAGRARSSGPAASRS